MAGKEFKKEEISENAVSFGAIFNGMKKETLCKALSLLISGDYSLADELAQGGKEELVEPLCAIYADAGKGMKKLMQISRQICFLIAKPKIQ